MHYLVISTPKEDPVFVLLMERWLSPVGTAVESIDTARANPGVRQNSSAGRKAHAEARRRGEEEARFLGTRTRTPSPSTTLRFLGILQWIWRSENGDLFVKAAGRCEP